MATESQMVWKAGLIATGGSLIFFGALWLRWRYFIRQDRTAKFFRLSPPQSSRQSRWVWYFNAIIYGGGMAVLLWQRTDGRMALRVLEVTAWIAVLFLGTHLRILFHELGHLMAGWIVGMTPVKLQVGTGPIVFSGRWRGGMFFDWRLWPGGGLMETFYFPEKGHRWRYWLMILGGPIANVILLSMYTYWQFDRAGRWPEFGELGPGGLVLMTLAVWTALITIVNFVPFNARVGDRIVPTDGWQLLTIWRLPQPKVVERIIATTARQIDILCQNGQNSQAWELLRHLTARYPDRGLVLDGITGAMHQYDQRFAEASECYEKILARGDLPSSKRYHFQVHAATSWLKRGQIERVVKFCDDTLAATTSNDERVQLLERYACMPITTGDHQILSRATGWMEEALQLKPNELTLLGTWGALLIEGGRFDEGEEALCRYCCLEISNRDRGISWYYRALIAQRRGESARKVRRLCRRARWMCPEFWLRERIRKTLSASDPHAVEPSVVPHAVA